MRCPSCGGENPDGFRFCGFCGTSLASAPTPAEERKVVTVLFCDLVGFTARSDQADPEDVKATLRPFHARLKREIEAFGGTLDKFIGDAAFGVFGSPVAHEDDPERAIRSALSIQEAIDELNRADPSLRMVVRQGINTGEAVVSPGAGPQIGEAVTGDVVNTASRLQSIAPAGSIVVGESTYRATRDVFESEPLPPVTVKGKAQPLAVWRIVAARARTGVEQSRAHTTPLVGRQHELDVLRTAFDEVRRERSARLVTIVGEAGVGKSRLVAELGRFVDSLSDLVVWRQGRCLPYGEGVAFWALSEIVKSHAGILESDSPENAAAKLGVVIPAEEADGEWLRQRLAPLIGVEAGSAAEREESFAAWRRFLELAASTQPAVFVFEDLHWADRAMLDFIEYVAASANAPLLLVGTSRPGFARDQFAWSGGLTNAVHVELQPLSRVETAQLLSELLDRPVLPPDTERVLLERSGGNPLYAEEFVRMLEDRKLLVRRGGEVELAEGADVSFPASIQALIAARLDTLAPVTKSVLQDAAVIGQVFWRGAVATVHGDDASSVAPALADLSKRAFIAPMPVPSFEGEDEFAFWHVLMRDVCYGQIPRARRITKHRAAAGWIEQVAAGRLDDVADIVAHHQATALDLATAAGDQDQVAELRAASRRAFVRAGDRALGLDVSRAEAFYARALALAPPGHRERPEVLARWADAVRQAGRPAEAGAALDEAIAAFVVAGDQLAAARATATLASVLQALGSSRQEEVAASAIDMLRAEPPGPDLVSAYGRMAGVKMVLGNARATRAWVDRAIALAEQLGVDVPARVLGFGGYALALMGDASGLDAMRDALRLAVERGEGRDAAVLYNNLAVAISPIEGPRSVLAVLEEGVEFCDRRGIQEMGLALSAATVDQLADVGEWDRALELADVVIRRAETGGDVADQLLAQWAALRIRSARGAIDAAWATEATESLVALARESGGVEDIIGGFAESAKALAAVGRDDQALELLREVDAGPHVRESAAYPAALPGLVRTALACGDLSLAQRFAEGVEPTFAYHRLALRAAGAMLAEARGDHGAAAAGYVETAKGWDAYGAVPERALALLGLGRCLLALGRQDEAATTLREARALFERLDAAPALREADDLLLEASTTG